MFLDSGIVRANNGILFVNRQFRQLLFVQGAAEVKETVKTAFYERTMKHTRKWERNPTSCVIKMRFRFGSRAES